jgi:protein TonB
LLQQRDRLTDATARSLAPLQSEGLVLRWIMRGEVLNGHEIELLVTALSEGPATPELFQIPADFHAVAPPASPSPPGASTSPTLITRVNPTYTQDAMRAKIQGSVRLEVVVLADGTVGDVRVIESLDKQYGLDQQAINAAKQWRFNPARRNGQPVPAQVAIVLEFKLHN